MCILGVATLILTLSCIVQTSRRSIEKKASLYPRPEKEHQWRRRVATITPEQRPCAPIGSFTPCQRFYEVEPTKPEL